MPSTTPAGFDESKHPRGQPDNPGKFKGRTLPTPPKTRRWRRSPKPGHSQEVTAEEGSPDRMPSGISVTADIIVTPTTTNYTHPHGEGIVVELDSSWATGIVWRYDEDGAPHFMCSLDWSDEPQNVHSKVIRSLEQLEEPLALR